MKKILIITLICILSIFIATCIKLELTTTDNQNLQKKIDNYSKENNQINTDNKKYENEINELKEVNKEKWEELEIWIKTQEKIGKALS